MKRFTEKFSSVLPTIILLSGILIRLVVYLQKRSVIVDEANVVRNLYERNYLQLLLPLDYQQMGPMGFLWGQKFITNCLGYGELAIRLYPFIFSVFSIILLWKLLQLLTSNYVVWYPLLLFASGYFYIRYATEVKQYSSDVAIALLLIYVALKNEISQTSSGKILATLLPLGIMSILFSMPSIFLLAGIITYYFFDIITQKKFNKLYLVLCMVLSWGICFLLYYIYYLKKDIHSNYMQVQHKDFFPNLFPITVENWDHSLLLLRQIIKKAAGENEMSVIFNSALFLVGVLTLLRKSLAKALLLIVPICGMIVMAYLHQFSLMERVALFSMPIFLLIVAVGFEKIFYLNTKENSLYNRLKIFYIVRFGLCVIALICVLDFNKFEYFYKPLEIDDFKKALTIARANHISGKHFHVNGLLYPVCDYYFNISPDREKWKDFKGSQPIPWPWVENCDQVASEFTYEAVLYFWYQDDMLANELICYKKYCDVKEYKVDDTWGRLYICKKK